jgi:LAO/AO transport system kinase
LEIADIFVVNKADRDGADATYRDIQGMIALGERGPGDWRPPVVRAVAAKGEGIDDILAAIEKHRRWLESHGELRRRREARAAAEVEAIALGKLRERIGSLRDGTALPALASAVADGALDPYSAARQLLAGLD